MYRRVELSNFKAFAQCDYECRPITLIFGPNNSGKSSALAPLRLLAQTLQCPDPEVPLLLNGNFGDFGTYKDLVHGNHRGRRMSIGITCRGPGRFIRAGKRIGWFRWLEKFPDSKLGLDYKYRTQRRELVLQSSSQVLGDIPLVTTKYSDKAHRLAPESLFATPVPSQLKGPLSERMRVQNFLTVGLGRFGGDDSKTAEFAEEAQGELGYRELHTFNAVIEQVLSHTAYIGAIRAPAERTYLYTGERRQTVGARGEYAAHMLAMSGAKSDLMTSVKHWFQSSAIASNLTVNHISDRHYELRMTHPSSGESENLADVGMGCSQVLPVLVAGFSLDAGSTLIVEEPEIHLHPGAQAELGEFFVELMERGVQSLVETHSEYLVIRLQTLIAERRIRPEDVAVYWVEPTANGKEIRQLEMNKRGTFVDDWPRGFFPERLSEAKRLARARRLQEEE